MRTPELNGPDRAPRLRNAVMIPAQRGPSSPPLTVGVVLRGIRRYKAWILFLWIAGTAGLLAVIMTKVKPIYLAESVLRVEPTSKPLFLPSGAVESFEPYLETQVQLVKSSNVLIAAASDPGVAALPRIRSSADAEQEIRKLLQVGIVPQSYLIRVAMASDSAAEGAAIVNAVVTAYLGATSEWSEGMTKAQIRGLETYQKELEAKAAEKEQAWLALAGKGNILGSGHADRSERKGEEKDEAGPGQSITIDEYRRVRQKHMDTSLELIQAQAQLSVRKAATKSSTEGKPADPESGRKLARQIEEAFRSDPEVIRLAAEIAAAEAKLPAAERLIRNRLNDPTVVRIKSDLKRLNQQYNDLWESRWVGLQDHFASKGEAPSPVRDTSLEERVEALKASKAEYEKLLSRLEVTNTQEATDAVQVKLIQEALDGLRDMLAAVTRRLEDLRLEARREARVVRITEARAAAGPVSDNRRKLMAAAPIGMLVLVLGFFVALEARSARVASPEDLTSRVRTDVYSVPPLPGPRATKMIGGPRNWDAKLQQFLQNIDHLRVALCGEAGSEVGRCLVISSATVGEGKTTLSIHLAARCASAGMATLLIDADLRRATLGRVLEIPEGLGLTDVVQGDVSIESALVVFQPGGFHVLTAGTSGVDPGRILGGPQFAKLLEQLRQSFDVILIDSPPLLPVPDALMLGRRADGVVMVTRYDSSRFPLVEQARQRLESAKIPILGCVINGVKPSQPHYDSYDFPRSDPPLPPATNA